MGLECSGAQQALAGASFYQQSVRPPQNPLNKSYFIGHHTNDQLFSSHLRAHGYWFKGARTILSPLIWRGAGRITTAALSRKAFPASLSHNGVHKRKRLIRRRCIHRKEKTEKGQWRENILYGEKDGRGRGDTFVRLCVTFILFDFFLNPPTQFLFIAAVVIILYGLRPLFISLRPRASEEERKKEDFLYHPLRSDKRVFIGPKKGRAGEYTRAPPHWSEGWCAKSASN